MGVFQKVVDTVRRTVKKSPQPQILFHVRTRTPSKLRISPESPRERTPCVNLKTLEGWKDFQVKGDVLLTEDDFTSPEPSRRHGQLRCIITGISLLQILKACHVVERKYSKQDFVAIYQAIGGYVFIHSKFNILPMTFGMHIAWDRGLILIYVRERKYDEREVKVGFSPRFDLVQKGITGFNYCGQTRAHPILLLGISYKSTSVVVMSERINSARGDKGDKRGKKGGKGDKAGKAGERGGKGGNNSRGGNDGKGREDGAGKDRGQDGVPSELGDLPHEGMVIHCTVMEEVSSTFANDGWAHFDGVVVDNPRPTSTATGMTEAQSIAAVWRNPHSVLPNHPHPLRYYLPLWNKLGNGFAKTFLHWSIDFTYTFGNPYPTTAIADTTTTTAANSEIDVQDFIDRASGASAGSDVGTNSYLNP
ncbi:hypothetical protein F5877DRAFT_71781 [Lentinula edodes]|nr:hypothetical protein F5877DRAFT_71781 [Lentinula edodes]